jgi:hypothetical protein
MPWARGTQPRICKHSSLVNGFMRHNLPLCSYDSFSLS